MSAYAEASNSPHRAPVTPRGWVMNSKHALVHGSETLPLELFVRRELT